MRLLHRQQVRTAFHQVERDVDEAAVLTQVAPREADGETRLPLRDVVLERRRVPVLASLHLDRHDIAPALEDEIDLVAIIRDDYTFFSPRIPC